MEKRKEKGFFITVLCILNILLHRDTLWSVSNYQAIKVYWQKPGYMFVLKAVTPRQC